MTIQPLNSGDQPPLNLSPVTHVPCKTGTPNIHIRDFIGRNPGDWPTENQENGNYIILCRTCAAQVTGPKRALQCWTCNEEDRKRWDAMTIEQQDAHFADMARRWDERTRVIAADPRARSLIPRANEETAVGLSDQIDLAATERARGAR